MGSNLLAILRVDGEGVFLEYGDIEAVALRDSLDLGEPLDAQGSERIWSGVYCNEEFGEYGISAYMDVERYIVVYHTAGVEVFNARSNAQTQRMYEELVERVPVGS